MKTAAVAVSSSLVAVGLYPLAGSLLGLVALIIAVVALYRVDRLARDVRAAISDQALGIQIVTDVAKSLGDDEQDG